MTPAPGDRLLRFVGDRVRFQLRDGQGREPAQGWRALLRTTLGRADALRRDILEAHTRGLPLGGSCWHDVPMHENGDGWTVELPLAQTGYFKAKAYFLDPRGWQHWPDGSDVGIGVHPDSYRTGNVLYCAFPRMFGGPHSAASGDKSLAGTFKPLDHAGYSIIPPSGKLRDLTRELPHIFQTLGCRILHLLPVNPTPTVYARFGRFGSPYAALDLTAIDPALVVFDRRTTGLDQFRELSYQAHLLGGRVFLDIVINHTGWGSMLQEQHPEWFLRQADGAFVSPGAWGTTWEDLVELKHQNVALWDELSEMFLTWCRRGVDGFRCDAGYKVPVAAWQYIIARVQQEHPNTLFLLEGLGGAWEATEALLTEGGMQWAYSELFQNYSGVQVSGYLDHAFKQSRRVGLLVHYSETHDNDRLAARGRAWSLLRNRLCGLTSVSGGFGFTCGVEWLAGEKIDVHGNTGMAWNSRQNLVPELARLNQLLASHPCFFDGAKLTRLSPAGAAVFVLLRESQEEKDTVLVLVNLDAERAQTVTLGQEAEGVVRGGEAPGTAAGGSKSDREKSAQCTDLLGQPAPLIQNEAGGRLTVALKPGAAYCLARTPLPIGLAGEDYRRARARAAWAMTAMSQVLPAERMDPPPWRELAAELDRSPAAFLAAISRKAAASPGARQADYEPVIAWSLPDLRRITPVPPGHWLLVTDPKPFRASLRTPGGPDQNAESIVASGAHVACFRPPDRAADARLVLERYDTRDQQVEAAIRFLPPGPGTPQRTPSPTDLVLLTNGRGGMARICLDLGRVLSKYDCVLGANLHPDLPVDRHVLVKRLRVWINADGFISPLNFQCLGAFQAGPPAIWNFVAPAGDGRRVEIQMAAAMLPGRNTTVIHFIRPTAAQAHGKQLPPKADVRLTARLDIEDRNFHGETKRNGGAEWHFAHHTRALAAAAAHGRGKAAGTSGKTGFVFAPASDRVLRAYSSEGEFHLQAEWSENIPHPVEQSRGQTGSGDAFSPGWFDLPLARGAHASLVVTADPTDPEPELVEKSRCEFCGILPAAAGDGDVFEDQLTRAAQVFVVKRGAGKTVIAGYPWFLDWGRDTFIAARGLMSAGLVAEVRQIIETFARFEKDGTLPNTIFGENASNRDTSDAPLWFGVVCDELARTSGGKGLLANGSALHRVLASIARHYVSGTPNGIRMDADSCLVWSPAHFTWMDTNYPAGTPREGYPVEIQALWIRLLRLLHEIDDPGGEWKRLAERASASFQDRFWLADPGWFSDVLLAARGVPAAQATADDALRSNCLLAISLGVADSERARRCVEAATRYLVIPGALRSLAPLPVKVPLPVHGPNGLLNDPKSPYWGRYEGDEDTRRKPAYHNGTAWTWTFPVFCEALARSWDFSPEAVKAAKAYLGSMSRLMEEGCLGPLPEIVDGDAPHTARGCDAQAWSATEALRVWKLLCQDKKARPA